jgi:hypothetical protein
MTARRRTVVPALAAAVLALVLGGCGSHHDSDPQIHGVGSSQNEPSQAPMADSGNHSGMTTSGTAGINGTPTPDAANTNPEFGGGAAGSVSTRSTPDSGLGMVPGGQSSGGDGIGQIFPSAAPG